jgi:hypothetical protein
VTVDPCGRLRTGPRARRRFLPDRLSGGGAA